jgi:MGT family glycosyltransferase
LNGKPLIYASFGTLLNARLPMFRVIAEACLGFDCQLLISLGGGSSPEELGPLPGDTLVMGYVPQLQILPHVTLMITHGGMNSVLECLSAGVPMVVLPVSLDQPAIAARVAWTGTGVALPLQQCTVADLHEKIKEVLSNPAYRQRAQEFRDIIAAEDGLNKAADLIEKVAATKAPVVRPDASLPDASAPDASMLAGLGHDPGPSSGDSRSRV